MEKLKLLDLFSGIGGFSLGLERSEAFETVAFCEIEEYPRKVLKRHWPGVPIYHDVRELTAERLRNDGITADAICGGFPCQDISTAGKQAGIEAERSGLWSECARILGELRPEVAIFENVTNLLNGGGGDWFKRVLWDISQVGYDAEWHCIPASHLGAPHQRDRVWIIAYPMANPSSRRLSGPGKGEIQFQRGAETFGTSQNMADTDSKGLQGPAQARRGWPPEPPVGRVANGIPFAMDRLKALGNAVVPQIPEMIGNSIKKALESQG